MFSEDIFLFYLKTLIYSILQELDFFRINNRLLIQSVDLNIKINNFKYCIQDSDDINNLILYIIPARILYKERQSFALDN